MNAISPEQPPPASDADASFGRRLRHMQTLRELGEAGMALARRAGQQALEQMEAPAKPGGARGDPVGDFERSARVVCRAIELEAMIDSGLLGGPPRAPARRAPAPAAAKQPDERFPPARGDPPTQMQPSPLPSPESRDEGRDDSRAAGRQAEADPAGPPADQDDDPSIPDHPWNPGWGPHPGRRELARRVAQAAAAARRRPGGGPDPP